MASSPGCLGKSKRATQSDNSETQNADLFPKRVEESRGKRMRKSDGDVSDGLPNTNIDEIVEEINLCDKSNTMNLDSLENNAEEEKYIIKGEIGSSEDNELEMENAADKEAQMDIDYIFDSSMEDTGREVGGQKGQLQEESLNCPTTSKVASDETSSKTLNETKSSLSSSHSSSEDCDDTNSECQGKEITNEIDYDPTPNTSFPKHTWNATKAVLSRQYGWSAKYSPHLFRNDCYGSMHMMQRLELMYKMKKHEGCVNSLHFNSTGVLLATGSDDLDIIIWDWTIAEPIKQYASGHRTNVFQSKFLPLCGDNSIVSCARDGQVRIGDLQSSSTRKLAQHHGAAHKLALENGSSHTFMSCGEDANVYRIDLRSEKPSRIVTCCARENKRVPLYSIFANPKKSEEFIVGGRDQFVRLYDTRFTSDTEDHKRNALKAFVPKHLEKSDKTSVTSVVYNYNGTEILASYNDEDIYLFDSHSHSSGPLQLDFLHRYKGHRNSQTVKGVNFYGPKSEHIISGSDCGFIFCWDKKSEHVVHYMYGDQGGVVNCLEPNPILPVLATSGLDDDIKIWVPSNEDPPDLSQLKKHLVQNMKEREDEKNTSCNDAFVDQTIWFFMEQLTRASARRVRRSASQFLGTNSPGAATSSSSSNSGTDTDSDQEGDHPTIECSQS